MLRLQWGSKAFDNRAGLWQRSPICIFHSLKGNTMPNPEWGTKRLCPTTGKRFYDLNRSPIVSPYTGEVVDIESARRKMAASVIARVVPEKDDAVLVDDLEADDDLLETATDDAELDDDLLEDDTDDNVSLDELADVAGDEDEV
jgi:uncharacterized protein (TIGR02300 family)